MDPELNVTITAFKYLSCEDEHVCRLCFASTIDEEVSLQDCVRVQKWFVDEKKTFQDIFLELGVSIEPTLPQVLCKNCASVTTNSYLFVKMCRNSDLKWDEAIKRLETNIQATELLNPNVKTAYLVIKGHENSIYTSKNLDIHKNKKSAVSKVNKMVKIRTKYKKAWKDEVVCEECGLTCKSKYGLSRHMKNIHSKVRVHCPQCNKSFSNKTFLREHRERIHDPKRIKCDKCTKMFSTDRQLKMHISSHHTAAICKLCFVQMPSKTALRAHLDKHNIHKCPRCDKKFLNRVTFNIHVKKICGQPALHNFFCDICKNGFTYKSSLRSHMMSQHGYGKVWICSWCCKKFPAASSLKSHIVKHTRERNFYCEHCGGKFVTQAALVYHIRLHTGEKPFPCELCGECFLSASRRMEHKRRKHFGPTKECYVCHAKFVTGHQLRKHVARHTNPFSKLYVPAHLIPETPADVNETRLLEAGQNNVDPSGCFNY